MEGEEANEDEAVGDDDDDDDERPLRVEIRISLFNQFVSL